MKRALLLSLSVVAFAVSQSWCQEAGASWLRSRVTPGALNPKISAIGDFVGVAGPDRAATRMSLREFELGVQADVDPYARADFFIAKPDGEAVEIEEGYVTLHSLPGRFQLRGGLLKPSFGRLNIVHGHELPQVDAPLTVTSFLGGEGLRSVGAEASRIFAPFGVFTELSYAFLQDLGELEEEAAATTTVLDSNGNTVTVALASDEARPSRRFRDFAHVARARAYHDVTEAANLELGVSGAAHQPREQLHRKLVGLDLTFRWRPAQEGLYRSFVWRSELIHSRRELPTEFDRVTGALTADAVKVERRGGYSYAEGQFDRNWKTGLRLDYSEEPQNRNVRSVTRAASPYVTYTVSEFQRVRLQYQRRWNPDRRSDDRAFLQWTVVLGPHGAHPF